MAKLYCGSCGHATQYGIKKPAFCSSCGKAFSDSFASVQKAPEKAKAIAERRSTDVDEEDDETISLSDAAIERLRRNIKIDFEAAGPRHLENARGLVMEGIQHGSPIEPSHEKRNGVEQKSREVILAEWQQRNGSHKAVMGTANLGKPVAAPLPKHLKQNVRPRKTKPAIAAKRKRKT